MDDDGTLTWAAGRGATAPLAARIRVVGAAATPATYVLRAGICRIGSSPTADVCIQDPTVSRQHVELELVAEGIAVRDLGSRNGTFFLEQKLDRVIVALGTQLRVGRVVVELLADADDFTQLPLDEGTEYGGIVGSSIAIRRVFARLKRLEGSLVPVLVEGESGVGKELVARALHDHSKLRGQPFVAVNCGAIPRDLVASELFGHKRGAFTGAVEARRGAFESADGGTLFLDELGELPLDVQPMLLRALESGEIRPVGSDQSRTVKVRVICATHRALEDCVARGEFREDLFYRVAIVRIVIPPLRERLDDVATLAERFARADGATLPAPLVAQLRARAWPGNVRQLRNAVLAYIALGELPPEPSANADDGSFAGFVDVATPYAELKDRVVDAFTAVYLRELMQHARGNQTAAARVAGLDRSYLGRLLVKFGIDPRELSSSTARGYTARVLIYRSPVTLVTRLRSNGVAVLALAFGLGLARAAHAEDAPPPLTEEQAKAAIEGGEKKDSLLPEAPPEAPPPPPRHKGFVIEQTLGALGFIGQFGKVVHPAFYMHTQFGYEIFSWLMIYAEGEFAFTDTSLGTDPTKTKAFPIFGFGGGPRFTIRPTERFAIYLQGCVGGILADVPARVLANLGYGNAESLGFYAGGRLGIEWYQLDRHIALGLAGGTRYLPSFKKTIGSDTPLGWDAEAALRYTF